MRGNSLYNIRAGREKCVALDELLATMLALQAYRSDHGHYPKSLTSLIPAYLLRSPADPFSDGKSLTYKSTQVGYLLYSIGPDGKDNSGRPIDNWALSLVGGIANTNAKIPGTTGFDTSGDIVAGVNH